MKNSLLNQLLHLKVVTFLLTVSNLPAATLYVSLESTNPTPPYTNWATAALNIQQAVDASQAGDTVLVTNGVCRVGQRDVGQGPSRVAVTNCLALLSVNGPLLTAIHGGGTNRCASLADGASLSGFTLTNGRAFEGGGVWCTSTNASLTNCTLTGNSVQGYGGGAYGSTLYNCTLTGNSATGGGGASGSALYNCTLTGNGAEGQGGGVLGGTLYNCALTGNFGGGGGGAYQATLYNCTVSGNSTFWNGGDYGHGACWDCELYNCIAYFNTYSWRTNAWEADDAGSTWTCCWASDPLFVDYAKGNLRLQSNSPCINAGNNLYAPGLTDLDGRPRILGGTVDMGAYEFQGRFEDWLQRYGLPTDGSADFIDSDHDGLNNWQEYVCGTNPTNALSVLRLLVPSITSTRTAVTWESVAGITYFLERGTNLAAPFGLLATNTIGQAGTTSCGDTNRAGPGPLFYRVGVKPY